MDTEVVTPNRGDVFSAPPPPASTTDKSDPEGPIQRPLLWLAVIFISFLFLLSCIYFNFPELEPSERANFKLPRNLEDAKVLGNILNRYTDKFFTTVLLGVLVTYVFLQSFAIPGSIFLTVLAGFLFPFPVALLLVCFCSAVGASICFVLSAYIARPQLLRYFEGNEKVTQWADQVHQQRDNLLNYMIFLRITPLFPNWFINITSPMIGVPFFPFFMGTLIGVAPPSCIAISAGRTLNDLASSNEVLFSWTSISVLLVSAVIAILPVVLRSGLDPTIDKPKVQ